jgi:hypothetical protein
MSKRLKTTALAASLALAGGAVFATAASAQYAQMNSGCWDQVMNQCGWQWQAWGLTSYSDCQPLEACQVCQDSNGNNCPTIGWLDPVEASRHDSHGH